MDVTVPMIINKGLPSNNVQHDLHVDQNQNIPDRRNLRIQRKPIYQVYLSSTAAAVVCLLPFFYGLSTIFRREARTYRNGSNGPYCVNRNTTGGRSHLHNT